MTTSVSTHHKFVKAIYKVDFTLEPVCLGGPEPEYRDFGQGLILDAREYASPYSGTVFSPTELGKPHIFTIGGQVCYCFEAVESFEAAFEPLQERAVPDWHFWTYTFNLFDHNEDFMLGADGSYRSTKYQTNYHANRGPCFFWDGNKLANCLGAWE